MRHFLSDFSHRRFCLGAQLNARKQVMRFASRFSFAVSLLVLSVMATQPRATAQTGQQPINAATPAQNGSDVRVLELGKPISREIKAGDVHAYKIDLISDQFLRIVLDSQGAGVAVILLDTGGKSADVSFFNSLAETKKPISALLVAEVAGTYQLRVHASPKAVGSGRYEVRIAELRVATLQDKKLAAAHKTLQELADPRRPATPEVVEKLKELLPLWQEVGDYRRASDTLRRISFASQNLGEYQQVLKFYNQLLSLSRAVDNRADEGSTLSFISVLYSSLGEDRKAISFQEQALSLFRANGDRFQEALMLTNIGGNYASLGEKQKALEYHDRALTILRELEKSDAAVRARSIQAATLSQIAEACA